MTAAAIAIVLAVTAVWAFLTQYLLPVRLKWRVVGLALALGALSPAPILLALDLRSSFSFPDNPTLGDALAASFLLAGLPEELVKGLAVLIAIQVLRHLSVFHQDVDAATAFRLPVLCGFGFAAVENIAYSFNANLAQMAGDQFGHALVIPFARSILASMLHAALGCLMGYFMMRFVENGRLNWRAAFAGYAAAAIAHSAVNWGLIAVVFQISKDGPQIDESNLEALAPHVTLAAILIPTVIVCALVSVLLARRHLRRQS